MSELEAAKIVLVRSVEEEDQGTFTSAQLARGFSEAGTLDDHRTWFLKRATYLYGQLPLPYQSLIEVIQLVDRGRLAVTLFACSLGLAANYFGPSGKIHILFNPLMALVGWNFIVYAVMAVLAVRRARRITPSGHAAGSQARTGQVAPPGDSSAASAPIHEPKEYPRADFWARPPLLIRIISPLGEYWLRVRSAAKTARRAGKRAVYFSRVAGEFWAKWLQTSGGIVALRIERALHLGAIALTAGAILGMYFRGLFLDYNVVWHSTFIRSEGVIAFLIRLGLGPAARLLGIDLANHLQLASLMSSTGSPAALWIHLYAVTAVIFILIPRSLFYLSDSLRIRKQAARIELDFGEEYYQARIREGLRFWKAEAQGKIQARIASARTSLAQGVAEYVCKRLYDTRVVPAIDQFQQNGGKLSALEARIEQVSKEFESELEDYVQSEQARFEHSLAAAIEQVPGKEWALHGGPLRYSDFGRNAPEAAVVVGSLGKGFTNAIGLAVSGAVAAVLGTVSGGFGKTLGMAIIVSLLHTTGPVAFIIGGIGGLLIAAGGWYYGRERVEEVIQEIAIPGAVARKVLWKSKLDRIKADGRKDTYALVQKKVEDLLKPLDEKISDEISRRVGELPREHH